jgi:hypothetical protein
LYDTIGQAESLDEKGGRRNLVLVAEFVGTYCVAVREFVKDYSVIVVDPGPHIMFNVICGET